VQARTEEEAVIELLAIVVILSGAALWNFAAHWLNRWQQDRRERASRRSP
jgi:hypothetical protein